MNTTWLNQIYIPVELTKFHLEGVRIAESLNRNHRSANQQGGNNRIGTKYGEWETEGILNT